MNGAESGARNGAGWAESALACGRPYLRMRYLPNLVCSRRCRQAVRGLMRLRRAYEYVALQAACEGAREVQGSDYQAYVDALAVLSSRAQWVAQAL